MIRKKAPEGTCEPGTKRYSRMLAVNSQGGLLRGTCSATRATFKLHSVKKTRAQVPMSVTCAFCAEAGHLARFCPSQPTVVPEADEVKFVEALLAAPREDTQQYEGLAPEEVMRRVSARAAELNVNAGNPFAGLELRRDLLRGQAGNCRRPLEWTQRPYPGSM